MEPIACASSIVAFRIISASFAPIPTFPPQPLANMIPRGSEKIDAGQICKTLVAYYRVIDTEWGATGCSTMFIPAAHSWTSSRCTRYEKSAQEGPQTLE